MRLSAQRRRQTTEFQLLCKWLSLRHWLGPKAAKSAPQKGTTGVPTAEGIPFSVVVKTDMGDDRPASKTIRPAGDEAELFHDDLFCLLRKDASVPDDFVNEGWSYDELIAGGGKGGTLMVHLQGKYIVKEMSEGDHRTLLEITEDYVDHVRNGDSRLCQIFLHYRDIKSGRKFFAMRNEVGPKPHRSLYDLKGCADDKTIVDNGEVVKAVHKRIWQVQMWCGKCRWSAERMRYWRGKKAAASLSFTLPDKQRTQLIRAIEYDCSWLARHRLMDYSLLVATRSDVPDFLKSRVLMCKDESGQDTLVCIGIIDFLQKWTCGKRVARCLKVAECNKATVPPALYAKRFARHFEDRLQVGKDFDSKPLGQPQADLAAIAPPAGGKT